MGKIRTRRLRALKKEAARARSLQFGLDMRALRKLSRGQLANRNWRRKLMLWSFFYGMGTRKLRDMFDDSFSLSSRVRTGKPLAYKPIPFEAHKSVLERNQPPGSGTGS